MRISDWSSDVCSSDLRAGRWSGAGNVASQSIFWSGSRSAPTPGTNCGLAKAFAQVVQAVSLRDSKKNSIISSKGELLWQLFPVMVYYRTHVSVPAIWRSRRLRSEEHTSELQSLMRLAYAVFCLKT